MDSEPILEVSDLSRASKAILYVSGISVAAATLTFAYLIYRCMSAISSSITASKASATKAASKKPKAAPVEVEQKHFEPVSRGPDLKSLIKNQQKANKKTAPKEDAASHHPLFLNTFKGHLDVVSSVQWSRDGNIVTTACDDMAIRLFEVGPDPTNREPKMRRVKTNKIPVGAGLGSASTVMAVEKGIPDAIATAYTPTAQGGHYELAWQKLNIHGRSEPPLMMKVVPAAASAGKMDFMVCLSTKKDVRVYSVEGVELAVLEPNSLANHDLAVSLDGRFIAVSSFTSEVKIWEMRFAKDGCSFNGAGKAMELKGHKSQVMCTAFSPDNRKAVTAAKDGTMRVWNIDVRYTFAEDPKTLLVIPVHLPNGKSYQRLAFGPTGIIAASYEGTVHMISSTTGDLLESIDAHEGTITSMQWCPKLARVPGVAAPVAVLATSSKDKRARLWRSP